MFMLIYVFSFLLVLVVISFHSLMQVLRPVKDCRVVHKKNITFSTYEEGNDRNVMSSNTFINLHI
jgi:hypothetical protein